MIVSSRDRHNDEQGLDPFFDSVQPSTPCNLSICPVSVEGERVFHTYCHFARATEGTQTQYALLDLMAMDVKRTVRGGTGRRLVPATTRLQ